MTRKKTVTAANAITAAPAKSPNPATPAKPKQSASPPKSNNTSAPEPKPAIPQHPKVVDEGKEPTDVVLHKLEARVSAIYSLQAKVEEMRVGFERANELHKLAKKSLEYAEEALAKEIREQRNGPGPLFNETTRTAPPSMPTGSPF